MNTNDNRLKAHKLIDHIFQDLLPAHGMAQRPEQIQLSHRMLEAMQDGRIALCDAGTGIGKTYAYLAAATAASAFPTGQIARPIIISTSSIALQNAVLTEYLPLLSCVLMADGILTKPLKAVIRKGKSHYVCDERLDRRLRQVYPAKKNPEALTALRTLRETLDMDRVSHLSGYDRERVCVPQVCDCKQRDCRYQRFLKTCDRGQFLFQICNHNLLVAGGHMTVINFEKFSVDVQMNDLYLFMRKVLEKQNYDARLGRKMLKTYSEVRPLREEEREYLGIRLLYPEKFWKLANYYYNTNKAWIPGKHMEKLEKFLAQREKRVSFSYELLYNNPRKYEKSGR